MWRASAIALLLGCSSAELEEGALVDLGACARGELSCEKSGDVSIVEDLSGARAAVRLVDGGSIALPIDNHGKRLAWIAIGVRAADSIRELAVTVDGIAGSVAQPNWGYARVEIGQNNAVPAANARLHLVAQHGSFEVLWVVGRWTD